MKTVKHLAQGLLGYLALIAFLVVWGLLA